MDAHTAELLLEEHGIAGFSIGGGRLQVVHLAIDVDGEWIEELQIILIDDLGSWLGY